MVALELEVVHFDQIGRRSVRDKGLSAAADEVLGRQSMHKGLLVEPLIMAAGGWHRLIPTFLLIFSRCNVLLQWFIGVDVRGGVGAVGE